MTAKLKPINGWTKAKMIEALDKNLPEVGRCMDSDLESCSYFDRKTEKSCAVGALLSREIAESLSTVPLEAGQLYSVIPNIAELLPLPLEHMDQLQEAHDGNYLKLNGEFSKSHREFQTRDRIFAWIEDNVADD